MVGSRSLGTLHETVAELLASSCRICLIFDQSIPSNFGPPIDVDLNIGVNLHFSTTSGQTTKITRGPKSIYQNIPLDGTGHSVPAVSEEIGPAQVSLIGDWLQTCNQQHENCVPAQTNGALRGLKVIDCIEECVISAPAACSYVALSYVWGENAGHEQFISPRRRRKWSTMLRRFSGGSDFKITNLPLTIQDSVEVTKLLGFRYL